MSFKFGDKVRISESRRLAYGKVGFISSTHEDEDEYQVSTDKNQAWYRANEIELVEPDMTAEEAWELARKMVHMTDSDFDDCFGEVHREDAFFTHYPQGARDKIRAWEENAIKVGDVVKHEDEKMIGVVMDCESDEYVFLLTDNGCIEEWKRKLLTKTGKHIDIQSILDQIGGDPE